MYFHIPVRIHPFIHAPLTKNKTRTRPTPSRRTHVLQLSSPASLKIFIAVHPVLLTPPHTSDSPKRANARAHSTNGNPPRTRSMPQSPSLTPDTNPEPPPENPLLPPP